MSTIKVLSPSAKSGIQEKGLAARPVRLEGTDVGLLSNTKANADLFLNRVGEFLAASYSEVRVSFLNPRMMIHPLLPEFQPEFDKPWHCVIGAWGD